MSVERVHWQLAATLMTLGLWGKGGWHAADQVSCFRHSHGESRRSRGEVTPRHNRGVADMHEVPTVEQFLSILDHNDALKLQRWLARFGKRLAG